MNHFLENKPLLLNLLQRYLKYFLCYFICSNLLISLQIAMNGFTEILTWILCSYKENFSMLNRKDDKSTAVIIGNPRSADFEVCL